MNIRLLITGLVTVLAAAGGQAQRTGSIIGINPARIPEDNRMSDADRGRATTNAFAECLLKTNPRGVERAVELQAGGPSENAMARLATDECLDSGKLRMPRMLLRGSAFVALYRRDFGRVAPALVQTAPDYSVGVAMDEAGARPSLALRVYGSCVIRRDIDQSRQFVLMPVGSKKERAALGALVPSFNACLPAGTTVHFSKAVTQGTLAEVLYRETGSSSMTAQAGTK